MSRAAESSEPEDIFVDLFSDVFGLEKAQLLVHEYECRDANGGVRFVDYAIKTSESWIAFEIDGPRHYDRGFITPSSYEDDLFRQNSLIGDGWRVFRWTDRQVAHEPEQVKEQLARFLESVPGLLEYDDFLPKQLGEVLELREHQKEARAWLDRIRQEGKTIALLNHATGTGKTIVAIDDARSLNARTLYLAHRKDLVKQTREKFRDCWPESEPGLWLGSRRDELSGHQVLCASIQTVGQHLGELPADWFEYLIVDEAHHATAQTYARVLRHFRPRFLLGLSATIERPDGKPVLEFFQESAHRMSLEEAVQKGELVPIRCVRVKTNVDLSRVRFNQIQYNARDIETTVMIPARDQLIVSTYLDHVPGKRAVVFCVNVRHGNEMAARFCEAGVPAASVSGRDSEEQRRRVLRLFEQGDLHVLCACDILNEGWDCPAVEALLMARPTLSRILYLQQLGRGTRRSPDTEKRYLCVFDFVDNAGRYNVPLSLHRIAGKKDYRPGALVLAPDQDLASEEEKLKAGEKPQATLDLALHALDFEEIDLFNWQEAVRGMISAPDLERELAVTEGTVRRAVERGTLTPQHTLTLGQRTYHYFPRDEVPAIRQTLGVPEVTPETIKKLFLEFVREMDMSSSYKPVFLLAFLESASSRGRAAMSEVVERFRQFYHNRNNAGLVVESYRNRMARVEELSDAAVQSVIVEMPLRRFQQRRYLDYARDVAYIQFDPALWSQLSRDDRTQIRDSCAESIERYYQRDFSEP